MGNLQSSASQAHQSGIEPGEPSPMNAFRAIAYLTFALHRGRHVPDDIAPCENTHQAIVF